MTHRLVALIVASFSLLASLPAPAQGLRPSLGLSSVPATTRPQAEVQQAADYIVAVVNSEPVTNSEVQRELQRLVQQMTQQRRPLPDRKEMARQVLENLINQKVQLQSASETGIRVDDAAVDQAVQNIARQNQMDVAELQRRIAQDGLVFSQFRAQLREQLILTRLREREVEPRVRVSDI